MPREIQNIHEKLAYALDRYLLRLMQKGRPVLDPNGDPVLGENGRRKWEPPGQAELKHVLRGLHHVDSYFLCVGSTDRGPGSDWVPRIQDTMNRWFPDMKSPPDIDRLTRGYLESTRDEGMEIFASMRFATLTATPPPPELQPPKGKAVHDHA